ncbi:DUF3137 domain-containing protein [Alkalitalea saponilacus]|uniref:Galanin n=1 Tax=Alkalitalea saponilacus TaxID=889453 RepID=A0A1T5CE54_9BACT|nr:DUF3137 domain-containing protein [Alkalitalea saponilacus]ASB49838.1 hypothetical protein CDL62_12180 [Alkalitalea saponilacus]SKB57748.1 Protein of unknown function [Alkalitalea saponilacus]
MDNTQTSGVVSLESLYNEKIEPHLVELKGQRGKFQQEIFRMVLSVLALVVFILLFNQSGSGLFLVPVIGVIALIIVFGIRANQKMKLYRTAFKEKVVARIVKTINPEWLYHADGMISESVYRTSDIFRRSYDKYRGDDLVRGTLDKTDFECSELHTQYREVTTDSKGRTRTRWVTIFKGLFFHADFNKEFHGRTYVSPDFAERFLGRIGRKFQKISGPAPLVVLENVEFEKEFVVHATDQIEARYILTPTIMEAMLNIRKNYNCNVHFSFIGSRVYCALSIRKNLFEPKLFGSIVDLHEIENMYHLFRVNEVIIHELNLNTRIWTKD